MNELPVAITSTPDARRSTTSETHPSGYFSTLPMYSTTSASRPSTCSLLSVADTPVIGRSARLPASRPTFVGFVHAHADQLEVGRVDHGAQRQAPGRAGRPLHDPGRHVAHATWRSAANRNLPPPELLLVPLTEEDLPQHRWVWRARRMCIHREPVTSRAGIGLQSRDGLGRARDDTSAPRRSRLRRGDAGSTVSST